MENVVLVIHLMIALAIIGLVLLQRSSGGGLGIGGGGGGLGDFATARSTANALTKATTFMAALFFITSLTLGILAKNDKEDAAGGLFSENTAAISLDADKGMNTDDINVMDEKDVDSGDAPIETMSEDQAESNIPDVPSEKE